MADIDVVYELERVIFPNPWDRDGFTDGLGEEWSVSFVAEFEDRTIGYLCAIGMADELHVHNIAVLAACRGRRVGYRLLVAAEDWAVKRDKLCVILEVRESNTPARTLYESCGYGIIGRRKQHYYSPDEDALVLLKKLSGPSVASSPDQ